MAARSSLLELKLSMEASTRPDASKRQVDVPAIDELFFQNLLLLGFEPRAQQDKHHIPFEAKMFRTSNVKGMTVGSV